MASSQDRMTFGALFRRPYQIYLNWLYGELATRGFPEVRVAHSALFRNITPTGMRMTDLAERAGMTKQSMAYLVEDLVASDYVRLEPDPTDGRAKLVRLTRRGTLLLTMARKLSERYEERIASIIGADKSAQLRTLLEQLNEGLDARPGP